MAGVSHHSPLGTGRVGWTSEVEKARQTAGTTCAKARGTTRRDKQVTLVGGGERILGGATFRGQFLLLFWAFVYV